MNGNIFIPQIMHSVSSVGKAFVTAWLAADIKLQNISIRSVSVLLYGSVYARHSQDVRRGRHPIPDNHRALMTPANR